MIPEDDPRGLKWLTGLLEQAREEPPWREEATKAADYYDGDQLTSEQIAQIQAAGQAPIVFNLIGPTVDLVLGLEARARRDWTVTAESEEAVVVAEALSQLLSKAEKKTSADSAISHAFASGIKSGVGWVRVGRSADPFDEPYVVEHIPRDEIHWDMRSVRQDLQDAAWLIRRRYIDHREAVNRFPNLADRLKASDFDWPGWGGELPKLKEEEFFQGRGTSRRVCVFEVWYRQSERVQAFRLPSDGSLIEFDKGNELHLAIAESGAIPFEEVVTKKVRSALWVGPFKAFDRPSRKRNFSYFPFFAYRKDKDGTPYGLIRRMIDPQDEVNARRRKALWQLSATRTVFDDDAISAMSIAQVREELRRPDATILLNSRRTHPGNGLTLMSDVGLAESQLKIMAQSQEMIQSTAGVYQALLGKESAAESGVAISNLIEQGQTTLAEIMDNAMSHRNMVGDALLDLIVEDIGDDPYPVLLEGRLGQERRHAVLNEQVQGPDGAITVVHSVRDAKAAVTLTDTPSSPAYRSMVSGRLMEFFRTLPGNLQVMLLDLVVESTDLPQREEMASRIRQATAPKGEGDSPPPNPLEEAALAEAMARIEKIRTETGQLKQDGEQKKRDGEIDTLRRVLEMAHPFNNTLPA